MAGRAARSKLRAAHPASAFALQLRPCVRAAFLFNILTLYYICKSMKWQDFGRINKDKFAAAAERGRQPCGLSMDYVRWARRGVMKRCEGGLSAGAVGVRWAKWCGSCGGRAG